MKKMLKEIKDDLSLLPLCTHRRPVEPVLMRRGEDDHHPRRSDHADQHGRHPPLGLEQRLAPRRAQSQVPVVPAAAQHHRLSEVRNETNAPPCWCHIYYR